MPSTTRFPQTVAGKVCHVIKSNGKPFALIPSTICLQRSQITLIVLIRECEEAFTDMLFFFSLVHEHQIRRLYWTIPNQGKLADIPVALG